MSDYTPTTEEVLPPLSEEVIKELALLGLDQMVEVDDTKAEQFLAHVDRWLAEVKAQEAKTERERIMKMLADVLDMMTESDEFEVAIQLIQSDAVSVYGYEWINERLAILRGIEQ